MKLSKETLERLRTILIEDFGVIVSDQELHQIAFNLVGYFSTLVKYSHEDKLATELGVQNVGPAQSMS